MPTLLLEGPFESDYSLAIVNRRLAEALVRMGIPVRLHQRDNTTAYFPKTDFLEANAELAPRFVRDVATVSTDVHSRYIYPPYTDGFRGRLRVVHNYGWEESVFPQQFVEYFNNGLDLVTTMSGFVRDVLLQNGVRVPVEVTGLGADHILSVSARPVSWLPESIFTFLHVSSCFPRKAADVLVEAFCREFTRKDDVCLIIKTFPNPHNEIEKMVREMTGHYRNHAGIKVVMDALDLGEMRYLYEHAGCLVSPSRGEGFGLPVAEAMFVGCPVIATIYSGQADICSEERCWPVAYDLEPARTHLTEGKSIWANPQVDSLREQMRKLYEITAQERIQKTDLARQFVIRQFTWDRVAERHWRYCEAALVARDTAAVHRSNGSHVKHADKPGIGFVTTWNTKCGIAEYTRYLATNLPAGHGITIFANRSGEELVRPDEEFVHRCWEPVTNGQNNRVEEALTSILESGVRAVSIQYNFGFFTPESLYELIKRLKIARIVATVTMHAVNHPNFSQLKDALATADFCICHRQADVDAVRQLGVQNVLLRKQGIVAARLEQNGKPPRIAERHPHFVVSCFGFFLPPKGIYQLIQAFALAKAVQPMMRLKLLNSLYPIEESKDYALECVRLIREKNLAGDVQISTAFLPHEETLRELAESDLVVLPYLYSTESSSAAGAFAIASLTPVLCSDLPLFDEISGVTHRFPSGDVIALANKLLRLAGDSKELTRYQAAQRELVRKLAWPAIAQDFAELVATHVAQSGSTGRGFVTAASS